MSRLGFFPVLIIWVLSQVDFFGTIALPFSAGGDPGSDDADPGMAGAGVVLGCTFVLIFMVWPALVLARRRLRRADDTRWLAYYRWTLLYTLGIAAACSFALFLWWAPLEAVVLPVFGTLGFAPPLALAMWIQRLADRRALRRGIPRSSHG